LFVADILVAVACHFQNDTLLRLSSGIQHGNLESLFLVF
jgi:hypothetical protein